MIFNRECRVPFVLAGRPRLASGLLPGLVRARDRFTARSPSSGVGDYFRFLLHRGVSQPPDPDLDRVWAIVPVTVSRASSAASGRCRPALTGVGAVPCDQSRAVTASYSRRITPPSAPAVLSPITARWSGEDNPISAGSGRGERIRHLAVGLRSVHAIPLLDPDQGTDQGYPLVRRVRPIRNGEAVPTIPLASGMKVVALEPQARAGRSGRSGRSSSTNPGR